MWHRLKSSLLALGFSALAVLSVIGLGEPVHPRVAGPAPMFDADALARLEPETRTAVLLAARLAALAIDDVARKTPGATAESPARTGPAARRTTGDLRMPFYSFATRQARTREI